MKSGSTSLCLLLAGALALSACGARSPLSRASSAQAVGARASLGPTDHPLSPLTAAETRAAFDLVRGHFRDDPALPKDGLRFPYLALSEPPKALVRGWSRGQPFPRHAEVHVLAPRENRTWVVEIDLLARRVVRSDAQPAGVQPAIAEEEYAAAEQLIRAYEPWQRAMRARGLEPEHVHIDVWAPGDQPLPTRHAVSPSHGEQTRLARSLFFARGPADGPYGGEHPYDRPIEGVVVTVDLNALRVVHMSEGAVRPVIAESGRAERTRTLRPLHVTQPDGSDLVLEGRLVRWQGFQFYVVLHPRDGLVLYDVRYQDGELSRPIAYRLSLSEIYVPYGLGDEGWSWRSAFDVGEYNAGLFAQTLERNRDVPDNAQFLDALLFSSAGPSETHPTGAVERPATIALYERDAGLLWTRTDPSSGARDTRMARELVAHWSCWIGNYIYGFDWVFKLDGTIEVEVQLTGTLLLRGADAAPEPSAPKVGRDAAGVLVAAPNHQHFFSFRLDLDVDGADNHVMEMEIANLPGTGFKNAFDAVTMHLDQEGHRDENPALTRHWHVESAHVKNALGKPTGYALDPALSARPYSAADFAGLARAQFAQHQLWMTRYRDGELYAAGKFPNQAKHEDGLPSYVRDGESLAGQDVVLWYTTGLTHIARPEDHPVMPSESIGFRLAPRGFFARNPALDIPDQAAR